MTLLPKDANSQLNLGHLQWHNAPKDAHDRLNIDQPRWPQDTFSGRAKHFFTVINPLNILATNKDLESAKVLVQQYRLGQEPFGTSEEKIWHAKHLYDSAFHPETGEKQIVIGRMSASVPMNMTITGFMMTFYKTTPAIIFWQWLNQSFNAVVNYTNRSGDATIPKSTLLQAYVSATGAALTVGLGFNAMVKTLPPIAARYVPFAAVAAANCVNIPLMRQSELRNGIPVMDENGNQLGTSKSAARKAIAMTVFSRVAMVFPTMGIPPLIMNRLEKKAFMKRMPWLAGPLQIGIFGIIALFTIPACCAIFPQTSSISVSSLEADLQATIMNKDGNIKYVYFNKGL